MVGYVSAAIRSQNYTNTGVASVGQIGEVVRVDDQVDLEDVLGSGRSEDGRRRLSTADLDSMDIVTLSKSSLCGPFRGPFLHTVDCRFDLSVI